MQQLIEAFDESFLDDLLKLFEPASNVVVVRVEMSRQEFNDIDAILRAVGDDFLQDEIFEGEEADHAARDRELNCAAESLV